MKISSLFADFLALGAGALLTLSFAPFEIAPLAIISPALLLATWVFPSAKRAAWRGWLFGVGLFSTGVYWIYISIHTFGNTSLFISIFLTCALVAYLSLFPALTGFLLNRFFPPKISAAKMLFAFPIFWIISEWLRCWLLTGFPWLLLGYSQINTPLRGYAPLLGVYGVSLAVLLTSGLLVYTPWQLKNKIYKSFSIALITLIAIWFGGALLSSISWTKSSGKPVQVSLIQGNVPQQLKWSPDQIQPTLDHYIDLTRSHWDSRIIIWPESAIPIPLQYASEFLENLAAEAGEHQSAVITGIPIKTDDGRGFYNGIVAVGQADGVYTKQKLVPFGEYIPFRKWLGTIMDLLHVPMSDFVSGTKSDYITANGLRIAAFVCYEIAYPELVRTRDSKIDLLLTISNDAWFGKSIAQAQHIEMAQMRALEMGRPILFVSNDGITGIINAKGKIQDSAPAHETYVLTNTIQTRHGKTPWQYTGMIPIYAFVLIFLFFAFRLQKRC